jgi:hypothetical protein
MGSLPFIDKVPVPRCSGVDGCRFEHGSGDSDTEWTVDNVGMTSDPSYIGHTSEFIGFGVDIENVLHGQEGAEEVSSGRVDDSFGFTGGSRGL